MGLDVFISYRRADGAEAARLIAGALQSKNLLVFLDVTDLDPGHFDESLLRGIEQARCFVPILTKQSLERPDNASDWFYREIRHALANDRTVIPLMMPGFSFPPAEEMPKGMETLSRHQSISYSHEFFDASVDKLVRYIGRAPGEKGLGDGAVAESAPRKNLDELQSTKRRAEAKAHFRGCTLSLAVTFVFAVCASTVFMLSRRSASPVVSYSLPRATPTATYPPTPTPSVPPKIDLNLNNPQNQEARDEVLKRIDVVPKLSQSEREKRRRMLQGAKKMGLVATVPFPSGRMIVSSRDIPSLKALLNAPEFKPLLEDPTCVFMILGYAESEGDDTSLLISQKRADSVLEAMRNECGVSNVMHPVAMGTSPLMGTKSRDQSRVVEVWAVLP